MTSTGTCLKRAASWLRDWAPYLATAVPMLLAVVYVCRYAVNVPWEDQWNGMLPLFEKWYAGTLGWGDFWMPHNEHRHLIPRLIMFPLALWTRWNVLAEVAVIQVILVSMLLMVLAVFRRQCVAASQLWLMLPLAVLVTNLRQNENFLSGWQIAFMLPAAAALGAFFCLHLMNDPRRPRLKLAGAIAAATAATFSAAFGPLVWPVGLGSLLLLPLGRRKKLAYAGIWLALGIAEWVAYFWGYAAPSGQQRLAFSSEYFATLVGGALFPNATMAMAGAPILLVLLAITVLLALKDAERSRYSFWLAAIAFGLLTQVVTTLGRSGLGTEQALASRYVTCSLLVVIGMYGILSGLCIEKASRLLAALWGSLFSLAALGLILSTGDALLAGALLRDVHSYRAFMFCTIESQPEETLMLSGRIQAAEIRRGVEFLRQHHWSIFATDALTSRYALPDAALPTLPVTACVTMNQPVDDKASGLIVLTGRAVNDKANDLVGGVFLEIDGVTYPTYYGWERGGVAKTVEYNDVAGCGFTRTFSAAQLGAGRHRLAIKVLNKDRTALYATGSLLGFNVGQ